MSDQDIGDIDVTGTSQNNNQVAEKTYSQKEVDDMMARTKTAITRKVTSKYEDLGDPDELRQLRADNEARKLEESKKRGEYDKIIADLAAKKDEEIRKRDEIIRNYTVDTPLVNAAAQFGSVNPKQVQALLKPNLRVGEDGNVEVLDEKGSVRYSDKGVPFKVEELVKEFLDTNPHFKASGPATTQSKSNIGQSREKLDITKLDMSKSNDRKIYAEYRKANGLA